MSSNNDLVARYLQAVGFWLPRASRHDILAEISEDLRSQMEDRAENLGRPLNGSEIAETLKQRGRPVVVASAYLPQRSLIGPVFFPIYWLTLRIALACYLVPWILVAAGLFLFDPKRLGTSSPAMLLHSLGSLWVSALNVFAVVTLIFFALDRIGTHKRFNEDWDPAQLPKLRRQQRSRTEDIAGIIFGILALLWILAVPNFPFLLVGPAASLLKTAPVWRQVYPLILVAAAASILEHVVSLLRTLPAWVRPVMKLAVTGFSLWIVIHLLRTRTYLLPLGAQNQQWVAATNLAVFLGVAVCAVGLVISLVVHGWKLAQSFEKPAGPAITSLI